MKVGFESLCKKLLSTNQINIPNNYSSGTNVRCYFKITLQDGRPASNGRNSTGIKWLTRSIPQIDNEIIRGVEDSPQHPYRPNKE